MSETFPENDSAIYTTLDRPVPFETKNDLVDVEFSIEPELEEDKNDEVDVLSEPKRRRPKSPGTALSRAVTRKVVSKTIEVQSAPHVTRDMVSVVLGVPNETVDIVSAIFASKPSGAFDDIEEIATSDPMEAAVVAASQGRDHMKAVWKLLTSIGAANGSALHP